MRLPRNRMRLLAALSAVTLATAGAVAVLLPSSAGAAGMPTVTVEQAAAQADPTSSSPILFDVEFSEAVTGFTTGDIGLSGTASPGGIGLTGSGASYTVQITGMIQSGTVIVTIPAAAAQAVSDGSDSQASTSTDNIVNYVTTTPTPTETINQAATQADPTVSSPILFDVVFSEPVTGFTGSGVILSGSALATTAVVTGSGANYQVAVSGMTMAGLVRATVTAGAATGVAAPHIPNTASTSTDETVLYFLPGTEPTVTINQASTQADPTSVASVKFDVTFSTAVNGFTGSDVVLSGTAGATAAVASGSGANYTVTVSGMTQSGTVIATIAAGAATDASTGAPSDAATSTDDQVSYTVPPPPVPLTVSVNQAVSQADPASAGPIVFDVLFSAPVTGFDDTDVTVGGTAESTTVTVTGSGATYSVAIGGLTQAATLTVSIAPGGVQDAGDPSVQNVASTSTDNQVSFVPASTVTQPTSGPSSSTPPASSASDSVASDSGAAGAGTGQNSTDPTLDSNATPAAETTPITALASTGSEVTQLLLVGIGLALVGIGLVIAGRRLRLLRRH